MYLDVTVNTVKWVIVSHNPNMFYVHISNIYKPIFDNISSRQNSGPECKH